MSALSKEEAACMTDIKPLVNVLRLMYKFYLLDTALNLLILFSRSVKCPIVHVMVYNV